MTAIERRLTSIWNDLVDPTIAGDGDLASTIRDPRTARQLAEQVQIAFNVHVSVTALVDGDGTLTWVAMLIERELNAGPLSN